MGFTRAGSYGMPMPMIRVGRAPWEALRSAVIPALLLMISCGGESAPPTAPPGTPPTAPDNVPPAIAQIADQTVMRNTVAPRSVEVDLQIDDPDDEAFTVQVVSDDEAVISDTTVECGSGPCTLTFTPSPDETAVVTLELTVSDGRGGQSTTSFKIDVLPHLVTNATDSDPGSLRAAVAGADAGDVLGFDTEGVFQSPRTISLLGQIVLDRAVTIEGPGAANLTVSGGDAVRVFKVTGAADVAIRGLTIADGRAAFEQIGSPPALVALGGAVFVDRGSRLTLSACNVTGSLAEGGGVPSIGGGIANFEATLIVNDGSTIANNAASSAGGILNISLGGSESVVSIENSTVSGNTAAGSGGGVANSSGALIVRGSRIMGNTAVAAGGVHNEGAGVTLIEAGSIVSENDAVTGGGIGNVVGGSTRITESTVEANTAAENGGGIHNGGTLTVEASRVAENDANGDDSANGGGGIYNGAGATAILTGSVVQGNRALQNGAGIHNVGTLEVVGNTALIGNQAESGGGGISNAGSDAIATVTSSTVEGNTAPIGAGLLNSATLTLEDSRILENIAGQQGGGLRSVSPNTMVIASTIEGNVAPEGGGIYFDGGLTVQETEIIGNTATEDGGGLHYAGPSFGEETSTIENSTIRDNTAQRGGGIFFTFTGGVSSAVATLILQAESLVIGNTAAEGGGLYQTQTFGGGSNVRTVIRNSTVQGNEATGSGGGLLNEGGVLTIEAASRLAGNTADFRGGGLYNRENPQAFRETITVIDNSTVTTNTAASGGGIYNEDADLTVLNGSTLTGNVAGSDGGAINNDAAGRTVLVDDIVIGGDTPEAGNAARLGGGIYNLNGQVDLGTGTRISGNVAVLAGGGVYNGDFLSLQAGSSITGNTVEEPAPSGGGVFNAGAFTSDGEISGNSPDDIAP